MLTLGQTAMAEVPAAVTGVVRDSHGTPQLGAMVQAIGDDASIAATVFTDIHGHYQIPQIDPGRYQIKATAALFLPSLRDNLQLHNGSRVVVNLTLSTFFEAMQWLPAQHRRPGDSEDDWKWTLRSAANRPILRMLEDGPLVMVSTSEDERVKPTLEARVAMTSGDSDFGDGGVHNVFTMDSVSDDGDGVVFRADLAAPDTSVPSMPSAEIAAGYERRITPLATMRTAVDFTEHPEVVGQFGMMGMQSAGMQFADESRLAPNIVLDAGSESTAVRIGNQSGMEIQPFAAVTVHVANPLVVQYRMATARDMQGWDDMDNVQPAQQVAVIGTNGKMMLESGMHQEFDATANAGRGRITAAMYHDDMSHPALNGSGELAAGDLAGGGVIADPATETFRMLGQGYSANGIRVSAMQPVSDTTWVSLTYANGQALALDNTPADSITSALAAMQVVHSNSFALALESRIAGPGTHISGSYRWQPSNTVTAVDAYDNFSQNPYLSFMIRQPIRLHGILPKGMVAMVDVTNLLAQGYRPVFSADGHTLYFAQSPRVLRGGLSFNF